MIYTQKEIIIVENYGKSYRQIYKKSIRKTNIDVYEYEDKAYHLSNASFYRKSKYLNRDIAVYVFEKDNPIPLNLNKSELNMNAKLFKTFLKSEIAIKKIEDEKSIFEKIDLKMVGIALVGLVLLFAIMNFTHTTQNNTIETHDNTSKNIENVKHVDSINTIKLNRTYENSINNTITVRA
jgi:hypothetical protein